MTLTHSQTTHRGNHREQNEDSCENRETRNGHLFVTCDGMGGAAEGKKASSIGVRSILEFFEKERYENIQIALYQSLKFANEQIYATAQLNPSFKGMGTTACLALFQKDEMYFAHVGDSRIYLQTDGKLKHLTRDHSFVNQLVDQGTIRPSEAKNHPEKNRILKALGVHLDLEPTVANQPVLLKKGDQVLLCSDGLTDMVSDPAIEAVLNQERSVSEKTQLLLQKALDNGGRDNITIQFIEIHQSPNTTTIFVDRTPKDLATTLTGEEKVLPSRKRKISKKFLLIGIPILLFLVWGLVSVFNQENKKDTKFEPLEEGLDRGRKNSKDHPSQKEEKPSKNENTVLKKPTSTPAESKIKNSPFEKVPPPFVTINYSEFNPDKDIFQTVQAITTKYSSLSIKEILAINKKNNAAEFKADERVFLSQSAYDAAHPKEVENKNIAIDKKDTVLPDPLFDKVWKSNPSYVILNKTKGNDESTQTVKSIHEIPKLLGISKEQLTRINEVNNFWDLDEKEIIYLTEERIGPTSAEKSEN